MFELLVLNHSSACQRQFKLYAYYAVRVLRNLQSLYTFSIDTILCIYLYTIHSLNSKRYCSTDLILYYCFYKLTIHTKHMYINIDTKSSTLINGVNRMHSIPFNCGACKSSNRHLSFDQKKMKNIKEIFIHSLSNSNSDKFAVFSISRWFLLLTCL